MHIMDRTPKIITIIGLVFEGFVVLSIGISIFFLKAIENFAGFQDAISADMTVDEYDTFIYIMHLLGNFLIVFVIIVGTFFIVNLYLFTKLIKGSFTKEQAKKVYLYQAIWGGINLLSNQVTGILYLISGVQGYNDRRETTNIREGI